jgi:hypothetical protein
MPLSSEWILFHLTPAGWVAGTKKLDGGRVQERRPPPDTVMTCEYSEVLSRLSRGIEESVRVISVKDEQTAAMLEVQFGPCPTDLML